VNLSPDTPLINVPFAVMDVEVTAPVSEGGRIVEIAIVRLINGRVVDEWSALVNPGVRIPRARLRRVSSLEILAEAPPFSRVWESALARFQDAAIVGHNLAVDLPHLVGEIGRFYRGRIDAPGVDTLRLYRALRTGADASLVEACDEFGITPREAHTAENDARMTADLLVRIMLEVRDEVWTLGHLLALQGGGVPTPPYPPLAPDEPLALAVQDGLPVVLRWALAGPAEDEIVRVVPLGLETIDDIVYLKAVDEDEPRLFRLDRIEQID
jgi:DNA polymerase III alpha subunit (gram-positive type)